MPGASDQEAEPKSLVRKAGEVRFFANLQLLAVRRQWVVGGVGVAVGRLRIDVSRSGVTSRPSLSV